MKKATLALAGLMAISAAASASMSRQNGFGASKQFIADVQDIWTLPAVVASNGDASYFEFGTNAVNPTLAGFGGTAAAYNGIAGAGKAWGGVHSKLGGGVLGFWFGRPYNELTNAPAMTGALILPTTGANPTTTFATPVDTIDVLYGFSLSETVDLGIGITKAGAGTRTETTPAGGTATLVETSVGDLGVSLGGDLKEIGFLSLLEIGLQYNMRGDANTNNNGTVTNKQLNSGTDMDIRIGGDMKGEGGKASRLEIGLGTDAISTKVEYGAAPAANTYIESKRSAMSWLLGYAMSKSSAKGMGLGGVILSSLGTSRDEAYNGTAVNKTDVSTMTLTLVSAGEAKMKEWLTARAGLSSNLFTSGSTTNEVGATGSTTKTVITTQQAAPNAVISTGLSLNFGDIVIDGVLNQDLLYTGTYLVSGVPSALFSQVSATWSWGGAKD